VFPRTVGAEKEQAFLVLTRTGYAYAFGIGTRAASGETPCSPFIEQELRTLPDADKHLRTFLLPSTLY